MHTIGKVDIDMHVSTIAGKDKTEGYTDGIGEEALFHEPRFDFFLIFSGFLTIQLEK